jgi:hypothetical protein
MSYFTGGLVTSGSPLISQQDLKINPPYNQEWNVAVQRELANNLSAQVAYVGNRGSRIDTLIPINYIRWANVGGVQTNIGRSIPTVPTTIGPQPLGDGTNYTNAASSSYNALQATIERRYSSGLQFTSTFTWAKLIDNGSFDDTTYPGNPPVENPANIDMDRGLAPQDIEFRFTNNVIYALPFGRGMRLGSNIPRSLDYVLGGWRVSVLGIAQSGSPFTPTQSDRPFGTPQYGLRPNRIGRGKFASPNIQAWFDPSAFAVVPANSGLYGNSGRGILRGPGENIWDASLMKDFHFTEHSYLELRTDAFNAFNHPWFSLPNANIQSPNVGKITATAVTTNSRELQGSVKLYF